MRKTTPGRMFGRREPRSGKRSALAVALVLAGCDMGPDPSPEAMASLFTPNEPTAERAIEPARGSFVNLHARPAPLGETRVRNDFATPRTVRVAVGNRVAGTCDGRLLHAFDAEAGTRSTIRSCTDRQAIDFVMLGEAEFAVVGTNLSDREIQAGLVQTRIGVELFALTLPPESRIRSLDRSAVRRIFTGEITDWRELGYAPAPIVPVVPADTALSERAARSLIPGDDFGKHCVRVASEQHVVDQLLRHAGAIGVIRLDSQPRSTGQRVIMIDWIEPGLPAFDYGTYPFGMPVQLVTSGRPADLAAQFERFTETNTARELLAATLQVKR